MPLPLLLVPLAVAGGSALIQTVAKLRTHSQLNALQAELEELESGHREEMRQHYDLQTELCSKLGLPAPELPSILREPEGPQETPPAPRWQRLLKRRATSVADGSPHTRFGIIGRQWAGFTLGTIWKTSSTTILNVLRPVTARLLSFMPRFATVGAAGGAGGSIAASTGLRFALGAFSVVGIVLGPVLTAWSIIREVRKVRKARRELESARVQRQADLSDYAARSRDLQIQLDSSAQATGAIMS